MGSVKLIVACNEDRVIGNGDSIPWHIPDELKYFKKATMGNPCIMGRKTWDSIPDKYKPLVGRENIVISRNEYLKIDGAIVFKTIEEAIDYVGDRDVFIIGGGSIYKYCLENDLVDEAIVSVVKNKEKGSVYFEDLNSDYWLKRSWTYSHKEYSHDLFDVHVYKFKPISVNVQFIDPSTLSIFVGTSILRSIIGWLSISAIKKLLKLK